MMRKITTVLSLSIFLLIMFIGIYLTITEQAAGGLAQSKLSEPMLVSYSGLSFIAIAFPFLTIYLVSRKGLKRQYKEEKRDHYVGVLKRSFATRRRK